MLDKDKIWIEVDIDVTDVAREDISPYIEEVAKNITSDNDGSVRWFFIPIKGKSDMKCIYSPYGKDTDKQLKIAKRYMKNVLKEKENKLEEGTPAKTTENAGARKVSKFEIAIACMTLVDYVLSTVVLITNPFIGVLGWVATTANLLITNPR